MGTLSRRRLGIAFSGVALCGACRAAHGQQLLRIDAYTACGYNDSANNEEKYGFTSTSDAIRLVDEIARLVGASATDFTIKAANVANAMAAIQGTQRMILYNEGFMARLLDAQGKDWEALSILAHEVGHHVRGHTLTGVRRKEFELAADEFSGFIVARRGGSRDDATSALRRLASLSGSENYPPRSARLQAVEVGFTTGVGVASGGSSRNPQPNPTGTPAPSPPTPQNNDPVVTWSSIDVLYWKRAEDLGRVERAFAKLGISSRINISVSHVASELLSCTPDIPLSAVKALALELLNAGVPLRSLTTNRTPGYVRKMIVETAGTETLANDERYPLVTKADLERLSSCSVHPLPDSYWGPPPVSDDDSGSVILFRPWSSIHP